MTASIDLNADVGEGYGVWRMGDDEALLDIVTSASVACGFHAGDPLTMRRIVGVGRGRRLAIGAHVAYPDRRGFGRREMDLPLAEITADIVYQVGALAGIARAEGTTVSYVKPHGALYNRMAVDVTVAGAVTAAVRAYADGLVLMVPAGSAAELAAAEEGVPHVSEAFPDRAYASDGTLVPRHARGAVIDDVDQIARRAVTLAAEGYVLAVDGTRLAVGADSLCIHGDTPHAVAAAAAVRAALVDAGVEITAFAGNASRAEMGAGSHPWR